jgi:hypothetical protein
MKMQQTLTLTALTASLLFAAQSQAASLNVDVAIDLPNAMILYAPGQIDLNVTSAAALAYLNNGGSAYSTGDTASLTDPSALNPTLSVSGTNSVDAGIAAGAGEVGANQSDTTVDFSIGNAFGVRSIGYSSISAAVTCTANCTDMSGVGTDFAGTVSPVLQTGSIDFTYDIAGGDVTATFQVAVVGT